jgi:hypothetical protein
VLVGGGASEVAVSGCSFVATGGYGVGITGAAHDVSVSSCLFDRMGQGGVALFGTNEPVPSTQPFGCTVAGNVMQDLGQLLKHVAGVMVRSASNSYVAHNRILRSPRYAIQVDSFMEVGESRFSLDNIFEFNIIDGACLETDDCGAIEVLGSGAYLYSGNIFRYNNISSVVDAASSDGESVCVHGEPANSSSCRNFAWAFYLDGDESGATIFGNVIDAGLMGAVFFNCGGGNNASNNVILQGTLKQFDVGNAIGVPNSFFNNVVDFSATPQAAILGAEVLPWDNSTFAGNDRNLYWCAGLDIMNSTPGRALFPAGGAGLAAWRNASGMDMASAIGDPLFEAPEKGNFQLKPGSPAWALGWQAIPPVTAPHASEVGARAQPRL